MSLIKKIIASLLAILVILPLTLYLVKGQITSTTLSNSLFMLSLFFLMITAFIAVFMSGFFDNFQKNMKTAIQSRKKQSVTDYLKTSDIFTKKPYYWGIIGLTLLLLSLLLTFIS